MVKRESKIETIHNTELQQLADTTYQTTMPPQTSKEDSNERPPAQQNSHVQFYIFILCVIAFSIVTYIFNAMQSIESALNPPPTVAIEAHSHSDLRSKTYIDDKWKPFNTTNPHIESWCPEAKCLNSPLCLPCKRRHFIIASTARSGSTTLLRMFNALPNMRLSGENHNELSYIANLTNNLLDNRPNILKHPMDKPNGPFMHNTIPKGSMGCIAQQITHNLNPPPLAIQQDKNIDMEDYDEGLILGFKTVRLHQSGWSGEEAAEYIKTHFPCVRILVNLQTNLTHQYLSYKRTFNHTGGGEYLGPSLEALTKIHDFQMALNTNMKEMSTLIDLDNWSNDVEVLNSVVEWMGYKHCQFNNIVHENDKGYATDTQTVLRVGDDCVYPFES